MFIKTSLSPSESGRGTRAATSDKRRSSTCSGLGVRFFCLSPSKGMRGISAKSAVRSSCAFRTYFARGKAILVMSPNGNMTRVGPSSKDLIEECRRKVHISFVKATKGVLFAVRSRALRKCSLSAKGPLSGVDTLARRVRSSRRSIG